MTDAEREAQIRQECLRYGDDVARMLQGEMFLLRLLDEARAEAHPEEIYEWSDAEMVERQHKVIEGQGLSMAAMSKELAELAETNSLLRGEIARLQALPGGSAMERADNALWGADMQRRDETAREIERAVAAERERIAGWIDCAKDCQHATASGGCHRVDDFCARYVADCIRRGCKP